MVLVYIPFVGAQSPVATRSTSPEAAPVSTTLPTAPAAAVTDSKTAPENLNFQQAFNLGTKLYQDKNYDGALENFLKAEKFDPHSTATLTDLGLTYYKLQKKGLAIAYFRRALFIDPSLPAASSGLKFALSELEIKEIPHQIETFERVRADVLNGLSLGGFHLLTALLLVSSGLIWLKFWGRRRKALELEEAPPALPVIGIFLVLGFLLCLSLTLLKIYDLSMPRATVIADKVSAQMAPGEGQNSLFELYAGFEVVLRNSSQDWLQVNYPGGLTGWVKKDTLMPTSGQNAF